MIALITGPPGVGKTSVTECLAASGTCTVVHFGELLRMALVDQGHSNATHGDLRREPNRLVNQAVIRRATSRLVELAAPFKESATWLVLESHAASPTPFGLRVTPDGPKYFEQIQYDVVIHLTATPALILQRYWQEPDGRIARLPEEVAEVDRAQQMVSVMYAALSECAVYFVDASDSLESVASSVNAILSAKL